MFSFFDLSLPEILSRLIAVIVALSFHEWAHAFAAYKLGDPTARNLGRMTINPLAHIDIFGFLMMILVRFGWAKPVPINSRNFKNPRRDEIVVSLAGVCMNFLLAFVTLGIALGLGVNSMYLSSGGSFIVMLIYNFIFINLSLLVFNLIPIPPLDGYRVIQNLLIRRIGSNVFYYLEKYSYIILIVLLLSGVITTVMSWMVTKILSGMLLFYSMIFGL